MRARRPNAAALLGLPSLLGLLALPVAAEPADADRACRYAMPTLEQTAAGCAPHAPAAFAAARKTCPPPAGGATATADPALAGLKDLVRDLIEHADDRADDERQMPHRFAPEALPSKIREKLCELAWALEEPTAPRDIELHKRDTYAYQTVVDTWSGPPGNNPPTGHPRGTAPFPAAHGPYTAPPPTHSPPAHRSYSYER